MAKMPIQKHDAPSSIHMAIYMRAYEVYCEIFSPQEHIISGDCRGGFGTLELIALLYAHSFPKNEWKSRFQEAFQK